MTRKICTLMLALTLVLSPLSTGVYGARVVRDRKIVEESPALARIKPEEATVTNRSVTVHEKDIAVSSVAKVFFDDKELDHPYHYTIKRVDDGVAVVFKKAFLSRQKIGEYDIRIEYTEHSLETTFTIDSTNSTVEKEPPRTKFSY